MRYLFKNTEQKYNQCVYVTLTDSPHILQCRPRLPQETNQSVEHNRNLCHRPRPPRLLTELHSGVLVLKGAVIRSHRTWKSSLKGSNCVPAG